MTYESDYRDADGNPLWEPLPVAKQDTAELERLRERKAELVQRHAAMISGRMEALKIKQLERDIAEFEERIRREDAGRDKSNGADAATVRKSAEDLMDRYAESIREEGETFEAAYERAYRTEFGKSILGNVEDAYRVQVGQPTAAEVAKAAQARRSRTEDAERELDEIAKRRAERTGETYEAAYAKVLETPEGGRLYADLAG